MREALRVLASTIASPLLRRTLAAYTLFGMAEWGIWLSVSVYAYERGGATLAGTVAVAELLPAAVLARPLTTRLLRAGTAWALPLGYGLQAAADLTLGGLLLAGAPALTVYAAAVVASVFVTATRPIQASVLPSLVRSPAELTAANVACGWSESVAIIGGPALAGLLIALHGPSLACLALGGCALIAGLATLGLPVLRRSVMPDEPVHTRPRPPRESRWVIGLLLAGVVVEGALDILYVVLAVGVLDMGGGFAGTLNASVGIGAVLGSAAATALIGVRRIGPPLLAALLGAGVVLLLLGQLHDAAAVIACLVLVGCALRLINVAARTLVQRHCPLEELGDLFGAIEAGTMAALATGSALVALLVHLGGPGLATGGLAVLVAVAGLGAVRPLRRLDATSRPPLVEIAMLRAVPPFDVLGAAALERLAREARSVRVETGHEVIREGDPGDCYYVVADGRLDVTRQGDTINTLSRGHGFGEIALLEDRPRTATVTASEPCFLYALDRAPFAAALTDQPLFHAGATAIAASRGAGS